jgi:hypothetical protein
MKNTIKALAVALAFWGGGGGGALAQATTSSAKREIVSAFTSQSASSATYTECDVSISRFYYGDAGYLWIDFVGGGSTLVAADDPNKEGYLSILLTAKTTSRQLKVRYAQAGAVCNTTNTDLVGIWFS